MATQVPTQSRRKRSPHRRVIEGLTSSRARARILCAFLLAVFFTGGSSRPDMQSLVLLRPISLFVLGYGLLTLSRKSVRNHWPLVTIAIATVGLMILHLFPLPSELWQALPGREIIAEIDELLGLVGTWRPLTLDPQATRNALMALAPPCAALVLGIQLDKRQHETLLTFVLSLGALTAVWGLLQLMGSPRGPFYLYSITNYGSPVGLFASRNHQAVFLASLIPLMYCWSHLAQGSWKDLRTSKGRRGSIAVAGVLLLVPLVLLTGSRAGLLALFLSICVTAAVIAITSSAPGKRHGRSPSASARIALPIAGVLTIAGLAFVTISLGRDQAFERLVGSDPVADMRVDIVPTTWHIAVENFPWGTGIGSFDDVFRIYEPNTLLMPQYVNHAHNDFLEVLMTGGLAGVLIMATAIVFFAAQTWAIIRGGRTTIRANIWPAAALTALAILFIASLIDYPLRVPAMASYAVLLAIWASKGSYVADPSEYGRHDPRMGQRSEQSS
ncbi:O-antigen ligase family protein [Altererythrobacter sp. C41]|uniref:O-antigen ligase family protein n=1 Tax=Altererythrobacter sp. C41 TaxID=2806021 RepID=UPI0019313BE5|nr:O-antigen ligase family protein [Altererythrobacter sp. C41]MBM0171294.1 O-antigen ligase family protein [Altererythrobacter sp. C41]